MKIIGKITRKRYMCTLCQREIETETNHYGEIYPWCNSCRRITVHVCMEKIPEGWGVPEPWQLKRLGDLVTEEVGGDE